MYIYKAVGIELYFNSLVIFSIIYTVQYDINYFDIKICFFCLPQGIEFRGYTIPQCQEVSNDLIIQTNSEYILILLHMFTLLSADDGDELVCH